MHGQDEEARIALPSNDIRCGQRQATEVLTRNGLRDDRRERVPFRGVVSFDDDGADEADFAATILYNEPDPAGTGGDQWEAQITLPDVECTKCTLRLQQIMSTSDTPSPSQMYFQCADLVLGEGDSAAAEVGGCAAASGAPMALLPGLVLLARRRRHVARR